MRIQFNKVTWYSKLAAVILFLIVLYIGTIIGREYQSIQDQKTIVTLFDSQTAASQSMHK